MLIPPLQFWTTIQLIASWKWDSLLCQKRRVYEAVDPCVVAPMYAGGVSGWAWSCGWDGVGWGWGGRGGRSVVLALTLGSGWREREGEGGERKKQRGFSIYRTLVFLWC